jgi:hypothetical protein
MSNRNFDASTIIKILKAQNAANNHNRYQSLENASINQLQPNPQTEHYDADVVNEYNAGSQAYYFQGVPITTVMSPVIFPAIAITGSGSTLPGAPTITSIIPGNGTLVVNYNQGAAGSSPIINYAYSTDGGTTFTPFSPAQTSNPLIITGLTNTTSYNVVIQAITQDGNSPSSNSLSGTPLAVPPAPTILSVITGISGTAVVYFSQDPYYPDITQYKYSLNFGPLTVASSATSPITFTGLTDTSIYRILLQANTSSVSSGDSNIAYVCICSSPAATIQTFFSATTWIAPVGVSSVSYLVVGGGGGGGGAYDNTGGGGGGGGLALFSTSPPHPVTAGNRYPITVGAGGAGGQGKSSNPGPSINTPGSAGGSSSFDSIIAAGGGGGLNSRNGNSVGGAQASGSLNTGGGGGGGGDGNPAPGRAGGGGGGNGSPGQTKNTSGPGGTGGTGSILNSISGIAVSYGLGGNGGSNTAISNGNSKFGNSGNGGDGVSLQSTNSTTIYYGGNGSQGVVILSY